MTKVFLSYSRGDDEPFVRRLYEGLKQARGLDGPLFDVWFDRVSMPSRALTFHQEIRDSIHGRDRLILVVGPQATASEYVTQEWQFAYFAANICVNPIVRLDGRDADGNRVDGYSLIPEDLRLLHAEDFRNDAQFVVHLDNLIRQLFASPPPAGKLVAVPELPPGYRAQQERLRALRDLLLPDLQNPVVVTGAAARVGLQGMGGIGKSVLANALARHPQVRRAFQDGIYWIRLGQQPRLEELQRQLAVALGDEGQFDNPQVGKEHLRQVLADRAALLILDDVWERTHAEVFNVVSARSRILLTTRDAGLVTALAAQENHYRVELPVLAEAQAILGGTAEVPPDRLPPEAAAIIEECGRLPLALALCGAMVQGGTSWQSVLEALQEHDLEYLSSEHPDEAQHQNAWKAMDISLRVLSADEQQRFAELVVFNADTGAPDAAVATLWQHTANLSSRQTDALLTKFSRRSLVQRPSAVDDHVARRIDLHDLLRHFGTGMAIRQFDSITALHQRLVDAYRAKCPSGWPSGPSDGYFFDNLSDHLLGSRQYDELRSLLSRSWMNSQLSSANSYRSFDRDITTIVEAATAEGRRDIATLAKGSLVSSSIRSISTNLPPAMVGAIARTVDPVRAIGFAALISHRPQRIESYLRIREAIISLESSLSRDALDRPSLLRQVEEALIRDGGDDFSLPHPVSSPEADGGAPAGGVENPRLMLTDSESSLIRQLRDENPAEDVIERAMLLGKLASVFAAHSRFALALEAADRIGGIEEAREQVTRGLSPQDVGYMAMDLGFAALRLETRLHECKSLAYTASIDALARNASEATLEAALGAARLFGDDDIDMLRKIGYALLDRSGKGVLPASVTVESYKERALSSIAVAIANAGKVSEARETLRQISDRDSAAGVARGIAVALVEQGNSVAAADTVISIPATEGWHIVRVLRDLNELLNGSGAADIRMRLFQHACSIGDVRARSEAIAVCSVMFTACSDVAGMESALDHANAVPWESDRGELLAALAQGFASLHHPDGIQRIFDQFDAIADSWARAHLLTGLAQAFAKVKDVQALKTVLIAVRRIDERARTTPLIAVSRGFLEMGYFEGICDALATAMDMGEEFSRAESIGGPRLVTSHAESTIHALYSEGEPWYGIARCAAKAGLTQEVRKALEAVLAIRHEWSRDIGLTGVLLAAADVQDENWADEVLSLVSRINYPEGQAEVLMKMSDVASSAGNSARLTECLRTAEHIDPAARARAVGAICRAMLAVGNHSGVEQCLQVVERYTYEAAKADAIQEVLPILVRSNNSEGLMRMAVAARTVSHEPSRCRALSAVAHAMEHAEMSSEAKSVAQIAAETAQAQRFGENDDAWNSIAEILSNCETTDVLRVALLAAERVRDANKRSEVIRRISTKAVRFPDLFAETRRILQSISDNHAYVNTLAEMSKSLMSPRDKDKLTDLWIAAFQRSMTATRSDTFYTLQWSANPIASLDGGASLTRIAEMIRETETWWSIA
jgi:hypothetical protein